MQDVTSIFQNFRECVRHIWNTYFAPELSRTTDWDFVDQFRDIEVALFSSLVLYPLEKEEYKMAPGYAAVPLPLQFFRVLPCSEYGMPIMINRESERTGYWDHPVDQVKPDEVELVFMRYFDWDLLSFRDWRYYEVKIQSSSKYPEIVGRDALIKIEDALVFYEEKSS